MKNSLISGRNFPVGHKNGQKLAAGQFGTSRIIVILEFDKTLRVTGIILFIGGQQ